MTRRRAFRNRGAGTTVVGPLLGFLRHEATGGILLFTAAVVAMVWANSAVSDSYWSLWTTKFTVDAGALTLSHDLRHWINSGAMVLFFFVVGLEIKRELVEGELRGGRTAVLPVVAAAGGVMLPVLIFVATAGAEGGQGWGIPMATDIAFAVGVLAVLGRRASAGARLFLLSIAIVDDIIAIAVIAMFYSSTIHAAWLGVAVAMSVPILIMRRLGVGAIWPYAIAGTVMWFATDKSGVHATVAGVVLALLTPAGRFRGREVAQVLQRRLHPVAAFVVVPLFALANAGVDVGHGTLSSAAGSRVTWAIAFGLLAGKTLGISVATFALLRSRLGTLPNGMRLTEVWGVAALAGIGFTVSLFIVDLAYSAADLVDSAKVGIFIGSAASGILGAVVLAVFGRRRAQQVRAAGAAERDRERALATR